MLPQACICTLCQGPLTDQNDLSLMALGYGPVMRRGIKLKKEQEKYSLTCISSELVDQPLNV